MDGQASWWTSHLSPWGSDEPLQELKKKQETTEATLQEMQKRLDELTEKVQRLGGDGPAAEKGNVGEVEVLMDVEREASVRQPEVSKYEMQESIWDATLLLYVGHAATSDMVLLIIGMIVNVAFQLGLLITIQQNMLDVQFDDAKAKEMMEWRVVNGQSFQNFDLALGMSRSERLCSENNKLWSFEQSEYDDMYDYLYRPIPGSALSTMAIVLWVLTCMREYRALVEQLMALMHLPVAKIAEDGSSITVEEKESGTTIIAIRPCARIMALLTLTLPRFAVLMVLSFVGCLYLAQTVTLADIVLNAVALAFVLDIDEALCHVLFSQRLRTTMSRVQPISCGGRKCAFAGIAVKDMVRYVWTLALILVSIFYFVLPFRSRVESAAMSLCAGTTGFTIDGGSVELESIVLSTTGDFRQVCDENLYERTYYTQNRSGTSDSSAAAQKQERLRQLKRHHALSYAFAGCAAGEVLGPKHPTEEQPERLCVKASEIMEEVLLKEWSVKLGGDKVLPRCPRFAAQAGAQACNVSFPETCEWSASSYVCEGTPPGDWQRQACGAQTREACNMWRSFGETHPSKNCQDALFRCPTSDTEGLCLSISGHLLLIVNASFTNPEFVLNAWTLAGQVKKILPIIPKINPGAIIQTTTFESYVNPSQTTTTSSPYDPGLPPGPVVGSNGSAMGGRRLQGNSQLRIAYIIRSMGADVLDSDLAVVGALMKAAANADLEKEYNISGFLEEVQLNYTYYTDNDVRSACEYETADCVICPITFCGSSSFH